MKFDLVKSVLESPPAVNVFKSEFSNGFNDFIKSINVLTTGEASYNDTWKDILGREGIAVGVIALSSVITVLSAIGVIGAALSAGLSIPVSIVGAVVGIAYHRVRENQKKKTYARADQLLNRENINFEILKIADLLADLYQVQLRNCTIKDAVNLAAICFTVLSHVILENENFNFDELLNPASLQGLLFKNLNNIPETKLQMNIKDRKKYTLRDFISLSGIYCKETNRFYTCEVSDPNQYGVLMFDKKQDMREYQSIVAKIKKDDALWKYRRMRPNEISLLRKGSMFNSVANDDIFAKSERLSTKKISKIAV